MPFAPPVRIAARPDSLALALLLRAHAADEFLELRELLLDHADGRLILERERLLVELLRGEGDDDLGPPEQDDVDRDQRLPQVILHARAAEDAAGSRLQRHRLVLERLLLHARYPIDRILQAAGDRPIVLRRHDDQPIGAADGVRPGVHVGRKTGRVLDVEIVDRKGLERRRGAKLHCGRRQRRQGARKRRVVGAFAQRAADHEHIELLVSDDSPPLGGARAPMRCVLITKAWLRRVQLFAATRAMKVANAASCCLMRPRVVSSLSSPVFSSNFAAQLPMKISGLLSVKASRNIIDLRRSYCTRAPPTSPGEADCRATGLPAKGWFGSRETQSIAFLSPPGMPKLYSGVQKITPSAARMASASVLTGAGKPVEFWISAL